MLRSLENSGTRPWHQPQYIGWLALGVFFIIGVLPVFTMVAQSLNTENGISLYNYQVIFSDATLFWIFLRSCAIGLGATLLTVIFGLPLALFLARINFIGKRFLSFAYLIPLFIPPHVHATAWMYLLGGKEGDLAILHLAFYSPLGVSFVLFLSYFPLFVLAVVTGLNSVESRLEEMAEVHSDTLTVWKRITLPLISPYIISGAVFVFVFSFFNYGVPALLHVSAFPVEIFVRFSAFYDEGRVAALSMPLVAVAVALLYFQKKMLSGKAYITAVNTSGRLRVFKSQGNLKLTVVVWMFFIIATLVPFLAFVVQIDGYKPYLVAFMRFQAEIKTSLVISSVAATFATVLGFFLAKYVNECEERWREIVDSLTLLPFAFPAAFFGIGIMSLWKNEVSSLMFSTYILLALVYVVRFIPFAIRIILENLKQVSSGMKEAAAVCEGDRVRRFLVIDLPIMRRGLCICWVVVFVFSMGELGATMLVLSPGMATISLKIFSLMQYDESQMVAASSLILVAINLLVSSLLLVGVHKK